MVRTLLPALVLDVNGDRARRSCPEVDPAVKCRVFVTTANTQVPGLYTVVDNDPIHDVTDLSRHPSPVAMMTRASSRLPSNPTPKRTPDPKRTPGPRRRKPKRTPKRKPTRPKQPPKVPNPSREPSTDPDREPSTPDPDRREPNTDPDKGPSTPTP